jgi:hypothetical protein
MIIKDAEKEEAKTVEANAQHFGEKQFADIKA